MPFPPQTCATLLLLQPVMVLAIPMALLFVQLDAFYARTPLVVGNPAVITVRVKRDLYKGIPPVLEVPAGVSVERPAVRVPGESDISWRIGRVRAVSGRLRFVWPGGVVDKTIAAGRGLRQLSGHRTGGVLDWFWHPGEDRLSAGAVGSDLSSVSRASDRFPGSPVLVAGLVSDRLLRQRAVAEEAFPNDVLRTAAGHRAGHGPCKHDPLYAELAASENLYT